MKKKENYINGTQYKIEKGIPIDRKRATHCRFPFDKMDVGDSFFIPKNDQEKDKASLSVYSAIRSFNMHHNKIYKISARRNEEGIRVWRVK